MELAFLSPSPMELMVIAVIALIVLGPTRLPDAARSVGKGMREMRDSFQGLTGDDDDEDRLTAGHDENLDDDPIDDDDEGEGDDDADLDLDVDEDPEAESESDDSQAAPAAAPGRS